MAARLVYGLNQSLDGYVNHDHPAMMPDLTLFRHFTQRTGQMTGSLYGGRMYGLMRYWDGDDFDQDHPDWGEDLQAYAKTWRKAHKWVASRTLTEVGPNATLLKGELLSAVAELKAAHDGEIEVAGPELAALLFDLIDEYQIYLHPVVLGSGKPFFVKEPPPLKLTASERIGETVIRLSYVRA